MLTIHDIMRAVITVAVLYVIVSNRYEQEPRSWAYGTLCLLIAYWFKGK